MYKVFAKAAERKWQTLEDAYAFEDLRWRKLVKKRAQKESMNPEENRTVPFSS